MKSADGQSKPYNPSRAISPLGFFPSEAKEDGPDQPDHDNR
jgi:hypothetical protein